MTFGVDGTRNFSTLSKKDKWTTTKQNFRISDIVWLKEDAPRNQWPLCKIIEMNPEDQRVVRSVTLVLGIDDNGNCEQKLCNLKSGIEPIS